VSSDKNLWPFAAIRESRIV